VNHNLSFGQLEDNAVKSSLVPISNISCPYPLIEVMDTALHNCKIINGIVWNDRFIMSSSIEKYELGVCGFVSCDFAANNLMTEISVYFIVVSHYTWTSDGLYAYKLY